MAIFDGKRDPWIAMGLIFGLIVVAFVAASGGSQESAPSPAPAPATTRSPDRTLMRLAACQSAIEAVKERLAAPSTAEFPSCAFGQYEIRATPDLKTFWVMGHVDAENEFGAKLRKNFGVELSKGEGESRSSFTAKQVEIE